MSEAGRIFQINISKGGVPKRGIPQVELKTLGLEGDSQNHVKVHGGPERAVCLYSLEHILALQGEGHPVFPGALGENLTLSGMDWSQLQPGVVLRLGDQAAIEMTRYTIPCNLIAPYFSDRDSNRISQDRHPGWSRLYARVLAGGVLRIGDRAWRA